MYKNVANIYVYHNKDLGISFQVKHNRIEEISLFPSQKYYSLMCNKELAKILSSTKSLFATPFKDRNIIIDRPASVYQLKLSRTDIIASCNLPNLAKKDSGSNVFKVIKVFTKATDADQGLTYNYFITGGKIIGTGEKVLWDLSGVKAGTYTITAAVDDGCGFCGKTITKTVVVKECPNCKVNN